MLPLQLAAVACAVLAHSFEKVSDIPSARPDHHIELFVHGETRLQVLFSSSLATTPIYELKVVVPTRAKDHSGLPHTLEHLVFMGSAQHPAKGYLDKLAINGLARGTGAYTADEHTCYEFNTASPEGLCQVAPVFMDHILNPLLRDTDFAGEVYRADTATGVVYSEMRGREWGAQDQLFRLLYEALASVDEERFGHLRFETGGRTSVIPQLTMESIRAYHGHWYRPERMAVLVSGPLREETKERLLDALDGARPLKEPAGLFPPIPASDAELYSLVDRGDRQLTAEFPSEDMAKGHAGLLWQIHGGKDALLTKRAYGILGDYLLEATTDPMRAYFTQNPDKNLATDVRFLAEHYSGEAVGILLFEAPVESLPLLRSELVHFLKGHTVNMARIRDLMRAETIAHVRRMEMDPHRKLFSGVEQEIAGNAGGGPIVARSWTAREPHIAEIREMGEAFWNGLVQQMARDIEAASHQVLLVPSQCLADALAAARPEQDGPGSDVSVQAETRSFDLPLVHASSDLVQDAVNSRIVRVETRGHYQLVQLSEQAAFEYVHFGVGMKDVLDASLWPYLVVFNKLLLDMDLQLGPVPLYDADRLVQGSTLSRAELHSLSAHTFDYLRAQTHTGSTRAQLYFLRGEVTFGAALNMLQQILLNGVITEDRIRTVLDELDAELIASKRSPHRIANDVVIRTIYGEMPNFHQTIFDTERFLANRPGDIKERLQDIQAAIRKAIETGRYHIHLASAQDHFDVMDSDYRGNAYWLSENLRRDALQFPDALSYAMLVPVRDLQSGYLEISAPWIPETHLEAMHGELLAEILSATEGPLYNGVREGGLAYGTSLHWNDYSGLVTFSVRRGVNVAGAYSVLERVLLSPDEWLDEAALDLGKKSMLYSWISQKDTTESVVDGVLYDKLYGIPPQYHALIDSVSLDGVRAVLTKFQRLLLEPERRVVVAVTPDEAPLEALQKAIRVDSIPVRTLADFL